MNEYKHTNKLINEKSPYLLQHAHNPVNWYPWGDEAFEKAKSENKPVFLSIGYSTCHWCHVMEKESFEDEKIAEYLNQNYVSIKVDREERPDIDHIYMEFCQAMIGHGGWPLTIFMTHEKKPFYSGTYFPKNDKTGLIGFENLLKSIISIWIKNKDQLFESSNKITQVLNTTLDNNQEEFKDDFIPDAFSSFKANFDKIYGGFGRAPKFPMPQTILFLIKYWYIYKDPNALEMVEKTLDCMYRGGIYDHIGLGFSRYSTDTKWLIPHFEKMLYDNALLAIAYLETYQATKDEKWARIANEIFQYVLSDMTSNRGGFFSALDADSEGEEGKFYKWSINEIHDILGSENATKFCKYFNITDKGNFEGENIPNLINSQISEDDYQVITKMRNKLFLEREKRVHPFKDDKILTSWNGLMIAAMAIGGRVLDNKNLILQAEKATKFIFTNLVTKDGRLLARYRDNDAAILGYLDDYALLIWGLIELYQSTFNPYYLEKSLSLTNDVFKLFEDSNSEGFFLYGNDSEELISRPKQIYDGAIPSGNSIMTYNLIRLSRLTRNGSLEKKAVQILNYFSGNIIYYPFGHAFSLSNLLFVKTPPKEIIISSDTLSKDFYNMMEVLNKSFEPFTVLAIYSDKFKGLENTLPFIKDYTSLDNKATAYICENFACHAPINSVDKFSEYLQ